MKPWCPGPTRRTRHVAGLSPPSQPALRRFPGTAVLPRSICLLQSLPLPMPLRGSVSNRINAFTAPRSSGSNERPGQDSNLQPLQFWEQLYRLSYPINAGLSRLSPLAFAEQLSAVSSLKAQCPISRRHRTAGSLILAPCLPSGRQGLRSRRANPARPTIPVFHMEHSNRQGAG